MVELRLAHQQEVARLAAQGMLWAIVDACDEPAVVEKAAELGEARAMCLYRGEAKAEKASIAPYLFAVDAGVLAWIQSTLAGKPWGIYVAGQADAATLARHFRSLLMVKGPEGDTLYFRFYDPRVLEMYLGQCNEADVRRLYGPVRGYGTSGPGPEEVTFRVTRPVAGQGESIAPVEIRKEQMAFFDHKVKSDQNERITRKLAGDGPVDEAMQQRIAEQTEAGRELGLSSEASLTRFVQLSLEKG